EGARAVCFPEYFLTGPLQQGQTMEEIRNLAETIPGPVTSRLAEKAARHGLFIVAGSMLELRQDRLYNTSALIDSKGELVGTFQKAHPENAPAKYEPGCGVLPGTGEYPVFDTEIGKIGIMIDMDGTCPEVPRILGLKGAQVIFWPVNWSAKFIKTIDVLGKASSIYSHAYIVSANPVGWRQKAPLHKWAFMGASHVDLMYGGGSGVIFGVKYLAAVSDFAQGMAIASIDTENSMQARRNDAEIYPNWRRPETYKTLVDPKYTSPTIIG
ncbi:MAG: carbon-nitrogen hydrolase family protein, partial [Deltaproteobacteria bacterium]|nr:carbon-nitrogen hydrolase family protein [Deltaproteobacteria bacterium]